MPQIDKTKPVLVTGATGYVAGWLVKRLLEEGVTVHAAVRDPANAATTRHLDEFASRLPGVLRYYKADLLDDGSYLEAMQGCGVVFHTASPFTLDVADPQRELVDPTLLGTRNVFNSVQLCDTVNRVVLTSSCAAVYGDNADLAKTANGIFTENDWNTSSSLDPIPYSHSHSKIVAEREAWAIAPAPALEPGRDQSQPGDRAGARSARHLREFQAGAPAGRRQAQAGVPHLALGVVDVRDLAEAHLRAAYLLRARLAPAPLEHRRRRQHERARESRLIGKPAGRPAPDRHGRQDADGQPQNPATFAQRRIDQLHHRPERHPRSTGGALFEAPRHRPGADRLPAGMSGYEFLQSRVQAMGRRLTRQLSPAPLNGAARAGPLSG